MVADGCDVAGLFAGETRVAVKDTGYKYKWIVYGELYSVAPRTIQRWVKKGRLAEVVAPLDDPQALRTWWKRVVMQEVPAGIVSVCVKYGWKDIVPALPVVESSSALLAPVVNASDSLMEIPRADLVPVTVGDEETGIGAALKRIQDSEAVAWKRLEQLMGSGEAEAHQVKDAQSVFDKACALRAKYEERYVRLLKENGELWNRDSVMKMIVEFNLPLVAKLRGLKEAFFADVHEKFSAQAEAYWEEKVEGVCSSLDETFEQLASGDE